MSDENVLIEWRLNLALNSAPNEDGGCVDVWELAPPRGVNNIWEHFRKHIPQGYHMVSYARLDGLRAQRTVASSGSSSSSKPPSSQSEPVLDSFTTAWVGGLGAAVAMSVSDSPDRSPSSDSFPGSGGDAGGRGPSSDW